MKPSVLPATKNIVFKVTLPRGIKGKSTRGEIRSAVRAVKKKNEAALAGC